MSADQLFRLVKEAGFSETAALFATALLVLHPKILSVTFNGTEAALSLLTILLSLRAFLWIKNGRHVLWTSLTFSALILTRMDFSVVLCGLFAGF